MLGRWLWWLAGGGASFNEEWPTWLASRPVLEGIWSPTEEGIDVRLSQREPVVFRGLAKQGVLGKWPLQSDARSLDDVVQRFGDIELGYGVQAFDGSGHVRYCNDGDIHQEWHKELPNTLPCNTLERGLTLSQLLNALTAKSELQPTALQAIAANASRDGIGGEASFCADGKKLAAAIAAFELPDGPEGLWARTHGLPIGSCFSDTWVAIAGTKYGAHYDVAPNIYMQAVGRKRWYLLRPRHFDLTGARFFPRSHPSARRIRAWLGQEGTEAYASTVELEPGDALFVPSGVLHYTETPREHSLAQNIWLPSWAELWSTREQQGNSAFMVEVIRAIYRARDRMRWDSGLFLEATFAAAHWFLDGCLRVGSNDAFSAAHVHPAPNVVTNFVRRHVLEDYGELVSSFRPPDNHSRFRCEVSTQLVVLARPVRAWREACRTWMLKPRVWASAQAANEEAAVGAEADVEVLQSLMLSDSLHRFVMNLFGKTTHNPLESTLNLFRALATGCVEGTAAETSSDTIGQQPGEL